MANWYVRSGAGGTASGADWTNAKLTLAAAATASAAGDSIWVSEDHAETQASAMSITFPGVSGVTANLSFVYCVDHAGSVPPVSADLRTTGTVTTTGAFDMTIAGSFYIYGLTFNVGTGAGSNVLTIGGNRTYERFDACVISMKQTGAPIILMSGTTMYLLFNNCTFNYNIAAATTVNRSANTIFSNCTLTGTAPTTWLAENGTSGQVTVSDCDLSLMGSGKTLVGVLDNGADTPWVFSDCKLGASVTVRAVPNFVGSSGVDLIRCDSGATNYRHERYRAQATQTVDTTIVRTGGATDGTTTISHKIVSTASVNWANPFLSYPLSIWNDSTSAITTLTIYGTTTGGGVPKDDEIWVEVEYLGSALTPKGSIIASTKADNLAASAATNNTTDASTWGGGGAGNGFKIVVPSFTPGMKGPLNITVKVAKASTTYYIDPKPVIN